MYFISKIKHLISKLISFKIISNNLSIQMEENNLNISDKSSLRFIKTPKLENSNINIKSDTEDSSIKVIYFYYYRL